MTFTTLIVVLFCVLSLFLFFFVFFNFQFIYSLNFIKYMSCSGGYPPLKDFKFYVDVDVDVDN